MNLIFRTIDLSTNIEILTSTLLPYTNLRSIMQY